MLFSLTCVITGKSLSPSLFLCLYSYSPPNIPFSTYCPEDLFKQKSFHVTSLLRTLMASDLFHKKSKTVTVAYKALPFSHHAPVWLPCYPKTCPPPSHFRNFALTFSLGMACSLTPFRLSPLPYQRGFCSAPCVIVNPTPVVILYSPCPTLFSSVRHLPPLSILHILSVYSFSTPPK